MGTETTYVKDPCDKQNSNPFLSPPLLPVSTTNPFAEAAFMEFFEAASAKGVVVETGNKGGDKSSSVQNDKETTNDLEKD